MKHNLTYYCWVRIRAYINAQMASHVVTVQIKINALKSNCFIKKHKFIVYLWVICWSILYFLIRIYTYVLVSFSKLSIICWMETSSSSVSQPLKFRLVFRSSMSTIRNNYSVQILSQYNENVSTLKECCQEHWNKVCVVGMLLLAPSDDIM